MQELETVGGRTATLTTIRYTGGEAVFSQKDLEEFLEIRENMILLLKGSVINLAVLVREVHRRKLFLIDNDNLTDTGRVGALHARHREGRLREMGQADGLGPHVLLPDEAD